VHVGELYHGLTMRRLVVAALASVFVLMAAACGGGSSAPTPTSAAAAATSTPAATSAPTVATVQPVSFPTTQLRYEGAAGQGVLQVEVASTPAQSERGLGYRDALPADAGMLFDLRSTRLAQFWMKGMRFALDFVWIGEDKRVAAVTADVPPQPGAPDAELRLYGPPVPVRYVLELNVGTAARLGIGPGTALSFELPTQ